MSIAQRVRLDHAQVGRDPVAGVEQDEVAGDQLGGVDLQPAPVAEHHGPARQQVAQALGGVLGAALLDEGEDAVHHDHDEDGDTQLRHAGDEGEHRRDPQQ